MIAQVSKFFARSFKSASSSVYAIRFIPDLYPPYRNLLDMAVSSQHINFPAARP